MKIPWAHVDYASKTKSGRSKMEGLAFRFLFVFLLIGLLISPAAAAAVNWQYTPSDPHVGDTL